MVEEAANFLGSPDVAIDDRHGPKMYSRFLHGLLDTPLASVDHSPAALKRAARSAGSSSASPEIRQSHVEIPDPPAVSIPPLQAPVTVMPASDSHMYEPLGMRYNQSSQPVDPAELFAPPLPFDDDLLHSMQTVTDANWANMVIPGQLCFI